MAGRMRPSRDHITPNTAHTAQGDPHSPTAPLSWTQRLKRVFRIRVQSRVKAGCSRGSSTRCSTSMRCRARVGFQWPSASARKRKHSPRPGASTRRSSRQSTTLSIAVSTGCAPTAPMGLHTPLHCRYWPPTCTASVCLCDGACVRPNDVEDAALPERGHLLRNIRPPRPAHRDGNGLRCPEVGNAGRFDAKHPSVVPVRPVPWPKPRRKCGGSSQISCRSGGFLADTKGGDMN